MQDARWLLLKDCLLVRGWRSDDETLHAPHDTMWFASESEDANLVSFRDHMTLAAEASAAYVDVDVDHAALHEDLVSLVEALDEVLAN
jgi:hypothetical protein